MTLSINENSALLFAHGVTLHVKVGFPNMSFRSYVCVSVMLVMNIINNRIASLDYVLPLKGVSSANIITT